MQIACVIYRIRVFTLDMYIQLYSTLSVEINSKEFAISREVFGNQLFHSSKTVLHGRQTLLNEVSRFVGYIYIWSKYAQFINCNDTCIIFYCLCHPQTAVIKNVIALILSNQYFI